MEFLHSAAMATVEDDTDDSIFAMEPFEDHEQIFRERMVRYITFTSPVPPFPQTRQFWVKERYMLLRAMEKILLRSGVTIFGGYVRDMIIHHNGANIFYQNGGCSNTYCDKDVHPESFKDRNTYPKDIDCFVSDAMIVDLVSNSISRGIPGARVCEIATRKCYTHHPSYTNNFSCKHLSLEYTFNSSLQKRGETIIVGIDMVYNLKGEDKGPWNYLIDCACNMLYMNDTGVHCAFEDSNDPIENLSRLCTVIELIKNKVTFIPPMYESFRLPNQQAEILNIQHVRRCTEIQAVDQYRRCKKLYRTVYRMKYLARMAKLCREGWKITNLNVKFSLNVMNNDTNGETQCSISHEDLVEGRLAVQLGNRNQTSKAWAQTSVLLWPSLVQYLFSAIPRVDDAFAATHAWSIVCPISKEEVEVSEHRHIGVVLKEAYSFL